MAIKLFLSISSREVSKVHLFIVSTTLKKVNRSEGDGNSPCSEVHKDMLEDLRRCRPEKIQCFYIGVKLKKKHNEIVTWCGRYICLQRWSGDSQTWKMEDLFMAVCHGDLSHLICNS